MVDIDVSTKVANGAVSIGVGCRDSKFRTDSSSFPSLAQQITLFEYIYLTRSIPIYLSIYLSSQFGLFFLSIHLSIYPTQSIYLFIYFYLAIYPTLSISFFLSIYLSIYTTLSISFSVFLSIYLSICLSIYLSTQLGLFLSIYLSSYISKSIPIYLSIYLSIYLPYLHLSLSIYLSQFIPIYLSIYLFPMECGPHTKGEIITLLSFEAGFSFWELGTGPRAFTGQPRMPVSERNRTLFFNYTTNERNKSRRGLFNPSLSLHLNPKLERQGKSWQVR
ncbi:unnamed protein product [Acanthosepion pharaonis]|uniref:Uncharacterized protein n=1 Tax=Acanthosepion pharaonis TaxID=158019 RepID=A0A812DYR4_ACAPH|nr:unnamed protein product [Sepia pharaonis]